MKSHQLLTGRWKRDNAVPTEGNGDLQTLICVLVARPRQCLTLSNPVPWQNWMAAYLGYTLFRGWPVTSYGSRHAYEKKNRPLALPLVGAWARVPANLHHETDFQIVFICMTAESVPYGPPYRPQPCRPQTILATTTSATRKDHIGHISNHISHMKNVLLFSINIQ